MRARSRSSATRRADGSGRRITSRPSDGLRSVVDLQRRLNDLDRALDREIRRPRRRREHPTIAELGEALLGPAGYRRVAALVERFDRIRGSERADAFGLDPEFEDLVSAPFVFLYRRWWRVETRGLEHVPASGAALLVANHAGAMFPYDGAMLKVALKLDHPAARELRPLIDDFVFRLPFLASFMARVGGVRACPENAERLLRQGEIVAVFPEGIRGMKKSFRDRYRVQRFGRGGVVTLSLRTRTPIVPAAIVGAEEIHPLIGTWRWPAKLLGLPYVPLTPTFPWLGLLGLVPLPSKWLIRFGEPIDLSTRYGAESADDPVIVDQLTEDLRERVQQLVDEARKERGTAFL